MEIDTHVNMCIYTHIHTYMHTYTHTHTCIHTFICNMCMYIFTHTCIHTQTHACIQTRTHAHRHADAHTHTHTHINAHSQRHEAAFDDSGVPRPLAGIPLPCALQTALPFTTLEPYPMFCPNVGTSKTVQRKPYKKPAPEQVIYRKTDL
jgi:hypothetical protein